MTAQIMQAVRSDALIAASQAAMQADSTCFACDPTDIGGMDIYCSQPCLTPCELDTQASLDTLAGRPTALDSEIDEYRKYLYNQQSWVCRSEQEGGINGMPTWHGELWVYGLYIAVLQMGGGVGQVVPTNMTEVRERAPPSVCCGVAVACLDVASISGVRVGAAPGGLSVGGGAGGEFWPKRRAMAQTAQPWAAIMGRGERSAAVGTHIHRG